MLLTTDVDININISNIRYYENLGYKDLKIKQTIRVPVNFLQKKSKQRVDVKCDVCFCERNIIYSSYKEPYYCQKCSIIKQKKTKLEKYGDEKYVNFEKGLKTKIEKYGTLNFTEKRKETNMERYGVINVFQKVEIKDKCKQTKLEKYGNEFYNNIEKSKLTVKNRTSDDISKTDEKRKEKSFEKHGFEFPSSSPDIKIKKYNTMLMKWGGFLNGSEILKEKIKETNLIKYGVENYFSSNYFKKSLKDKQLVKYKECDIIDIIDNKYILKCDIGCEHIYETYNHILYVRLKSKTTLCTICNPISKNISGLEIGLQNFIKENYNYPIELNNRKILKPYELDIFLPDLKLAFEFNGLYWYNELNKINSYHLLKTESCEEKGIHLIHIYEDDWLYKQEIVKSRILNLLGKTKNKIYARKCIIKEVTDNKIVRDFLNDNHLQGFVGSQIKLGLFHENKLVSLMTFGKTRKSLVFVNQDGYEMLRFCNKLNTIVIGGVDILFKYFIKNYKPTEVISYIDRSWSRGDLYKKLGFTFVCKTKPNYHYIIGNIRKNKFNFRKDILIKQGYDKMKIEHEIMLERNIYRIYDSGSLKFIFYLQS